MVEKHYTLETIKRLYEVEQLTLQQVADRLGVTRQAVHDQLVRNGIERRPRSPQSRTIDRATLYRLYVTNQLGICAVAKELRASYSLVCRELKRHSIEKRPRGFDWRKIHELDSILIGESVVIRRPIRPKPHSSLYGAASVRGIRISIRRVDAEFVRVTRLG